MRIRFPWPLLATGIVGLSVAGVWWSRKASAASESELATTVQSINFLVTVTTAGELHAPKFVTITAPQGLQRAQLYQIKIAALVPEGTVVQKGDVVAELDRTPLAERLRDVELQVQRAQVAYEQATLDSTLNLSKERDNLQMLQSTLEEKTLAEQQVAFEAPAIKRQAAIDLERAKRGLQQAKLDYQTKVKQAEAKMRDVGTDLEQTQRRYQAVQNVGDEFAIRAPTSGIITYAKEWDGSKRTVGSQVSDWNSTVATLPDLKIMESVTYLNEIDIRKVAIGRPVTLKLDADPSKVLRGRVATVANAGEQRPNSDAKVFEVHIAIEGTDTTLRPGMTTSNIIGVRQVPHALVVPLEALGNEKGVPFVYRRSAGHLVKQEVMTDAINEDAVVIVRGLTAGDRVLLSPPANTDRLSLVRLPPASGPAGSATVR